MTESTSTTTTNLTDFQKRTFEAFLPVVVQELSNSEPSVRAMLKRAKTDGVSRVLSVAYSDFDSFCCALIRERILMSYMTPEVWSAVQKVQSTPVPKLDGPNQFYLVYGVSNLIKVYVLNLTTEDLGPVPAEPAAEAPAEALAEPEAVDKVKEIDE